jgi:hypothetical protein
VTEDEAEDDDDEEEDAEPPRAAAVNCFALPGLVGATKLNAGCWRGTVRRQIPSQ